MRDQGRVREEKHFSEYFNQCFLVFKSKYSAYNHFYGKESHATHVPSLKIRIKNIKDSNRQTNILF